MSDDPRHKVVVAAIIERDGKVLAHRRPEGGWGAGQWEFPGGKLEPGEDPREAIRRECEEELGAGVKPGDVFEVLSHRYDDIGSVVLLFIRGTIVSGEPQALTGGELLWVDSSTIGELDWLPADLPVVEGLCRSGLLRS